MSLKKSDPSDPADASTVVSAPDDVRATDAAPGGPAPGGPAGAGSAVAAVPSDLASSLQAPVLLGRRSRIASLRSNLPLPLLLAAVVALGWLIEEADLVVPYFQRILLLIGFNIILVCGLQLINGFSGQFSLGHAGFMAVGAYLAAYPAKEHAHLVSGGAGSRVIDDPIRVLLFYLSLGIVLALAGLLVAGFLQLLRSTRKLHAQAPALIMLASLLWIVWDVAQASKTAEPPAYLVWSQLIQLFTGAFDGAMSGLAPAAQSLSLTLPAAAREPLCFIILVLGGGAFAAATGLIVGLPTLRLRGDYLAIATLGLAEIVRIAIQNSEPLGGPLGLSMIPKYTNFAWLYAFVLVTVVLVWRLAYSARGRLIQAVREDEVAAAAAGIDPTRQKVLSFIVGAFFGGVAGALFAMNERSITPSYFGLQKSIEVVVMVTLGGLGSISGAILAAIVLTLLPEMLREVNNYRMIIYALLLVVMMLVRPQGLLGGIELWPRRKYVYRPPKERGFEVSVARPAPVATAAVAGDAATTAAGAAFATAAHDALEQITLKADGVSRRFGGLAALNDFNLTIRTGELVGLIGPNGAGKTTAFNVITGVYAPSDGQVLLGERRIDGLSTVWINRHGVARTFQNIRLFKNLTVLDNVAAALRNRTELSVWRTLLRTPRFYRERATSEAQSIALLETMRLAHLANHVAGSLSYGDQRRLEIARALATKPSILLLDEPAAGMNPQEKLELMRLIRFIREQFAVGILLIEHDMKLVMNVCERITVLDHGEIIAVGTPAEIQADPKVIEAYLGEPG